MLWGAHVEYAQGPWIFRIGSGAINLDEPIQFGGLVEALRATGVPQSIALANDPDDKARQTWFHVAGLPYAKGPTPIPLFHAHLDTETHGHPSAPVGQIDGRYRHSTF